MMASLYVKPMLTFLPPFLIAIRYWTENKKIIGLLKIFLFFMTLQILVLSPWWFRSYRIFGQVVPFTTTSTMNLYLGNNIKNKDGGNDWGVDAEKRFRVYDEESELSSWKMYKEETIKFISEHSAHALKLLVKKFFRFWSVTPNAEKFNTAPYKQLSILFFGTLILSFLFSTFFLMKKKRSIIMFYLPVYLIILYFTVIHTVTIASLRYRLPLAPFLIVISTQFIVQLKEKIYERKHQTT